MRVCVYVCARAPLSLTFTVAVLKLVGDAFLGEALEIVVDGVRRLRALARPAVHVARVKLEPLGRGAGESFVVVVVVGDRVPNRRGCTLAVAVQVAFVKARA